MTTVQLLGDPAQLVTTALRGFAAENARLVRFDADSKIVRRATPATSKVALVSGGGSGHEPLHLGFVGTGMLDAAVPGEVFASPTAGQVAAAIRAVDGGAGVLLIVKNYTGDVINFALAAELAADEGIKVQTVLVADDLASDSDDGPGRRGTAATVLVEKLAGAAAERGDSLDQVAAIARSIADRSRSLAVAFRSATLPGQPAPSFELPSGELEFGVGIHGERGRGQRAVASADEIVDLVLEPLLAELAPREGDEVFAIVNGLGGTPGLQLSAARWIIGEKLRERGIAIARSLTGSYVTALDMQGFSLTLAVATPDDLALWDAPVQTAALTW